MFAKSDEEIGMVVARVKRICGAGKNGGVDGAGTMGAGDTEYVARCQMGALQTEIYIENVAGTETLIVSLP